MRYLFFTLLCFSFTSGTFAQDITYFDQFWQKTEDKGNAAYYREAYPETGGWRVKDYYITGALQMEGYVISLEPNVQEGLSTYYFPNGRVNKRAWYSNEGKEEKVADIYDEEGKAIVEKGNGIYQEHDPTSRRTIVYTYRDSLLTTCYYTRTQTRDTIYVKADTSAEPKEGMQAFYTHYLSKIKYPFMPRLKGVEKNIYVKFLVDTDGRLTEFESLDPSGYSFDAKTIKYLSKAPAWKPALLNQKPVKMEFILPVRFVLD